MPTTRQSPRRGYTLIEVVAVVVILGTVSAIVLPNFGRHDDMKVSAAARQVVADLLYCQSRAIATGRMQYLAFDVEHQTYALMDCISPVKTIINPATGDRYEVKLNAGPLSGVTTARVDFDGRPVIAFDAMGVPHTISDSSLAPSLMRSGSIELTCGAAHLTVTVEPMTGEIKVR